MTQQKLYEWLTHPESLNRETLYELRTLLARYPYFQTARLLYLKNLFLLHDITFGEELRRAALYIADRSVLFHLIEGDRFKIVPFPEKKEPEEGKEGLDRTLSLIDAFLSTVPREETPTPNLPAANIAADYASYLLREEEQKSVATGSENDACSMKGQDLIDEFIEKVEEEPFSVSLDVKKTEQPAAVEETEEQPETHEEEEYDESYFTETLAKIYVKQRRYSKALEIIKKLNLKYPKKNAYFADQIRFLEKLIINTKSK